MIQRPLREAEFAVYLVDPGHPGRRLIPLLRELTRGTPDTCAYLLHHVPSLVAVCQTREAAEAVVGRFREQHAVAQIRPASEPVKEGAAAEPPGPAARRPILLLAALLAVVQIALAASWIAAGRLLAGIAGLILGVVVLVGALILRREA